MKQTAAAVLFSITCLASCSRHNGPVAARANEVASSLQFSLWEEFGAMRKRIVADPFETDETGAEHFYRQTAVGRIAVVVHFAKDESQSHLNPDLRVSSLSFIFDKDVALRDALAAIPEVRELCAQGCRTTGEKEPLEAELIPMHPTEQQSKIVKAIAMSDLSSRWGINRSQHADRCASVIAVAYQSPIGIPDFETTAVSSIGVLVKDTVEDPRFKGMHHKISLREWNPNATAGSSP